MIKRHETRIATAAIIGLAMLAACSDASPPVADPVARASAALGGTGVEVVDPAAPDDLAASVALVYYYARTGSKACSGTLIDRDLLVTAGGCVLNSAGNVVAPGSLSVWFSGADFEEDNANYWEVAQVTLLQTDAEQKYALALLRLQTEVPASVVASTPPLFLGNVNSLLDDTAYADPIMMGFGCEDEDPECVQWARRKVSFEGVELIDLPTLEPSLAYIDLAGPDPAPYNHDLGGPLFMFDTVSARWVLAGVLNHFLHETTGDPVYVGPNWSYLGHPGVAGGPEDHAPLIRGHLGADDDDDGIPDLFDNCPPSACVAAGLDPVICANADQASAMGGMGDACAFADARWVDARNTNAEVEEDLDVVAIPDGYDPVPLLRMESDPNLIEVIGGTQEQIGIRARSWMGALSDVDRLQGAEETFNEEIGFRYCGCYDSDGVRQAESECVESGTCVPGEAVYAAEGTSFSPIVVKEKISQSYIYDPRYGPGGGLPQDFKASFAGEQLEIVWDWYAAYSTGQIPGEEIEIAGGDVIAATHGFVASAVIHNAGHYASRRDGDTFGRLRADLLLLTVPEASDIPVYIPDSPPIVEANPCFFFDCGWPFHWPWEDYINVLSGVRNLINEPMLVQLDPDTHQPFATAWWNGPWRIDFGKALGDTTAWAFPDADARWPVIAPVETIARLRAQEIDSRAMLLAPHGTGASRAYRVFADGEGLQVEDVAAPWQMLASGGEEPVEMPLGGKAVYSATRGELLLVGGSDRLPTQRLRRYDTATHQLVGIPVSADLAPGAQVMGAAFDAAQNLLYVLDVTGNGEETRLVAHDLNGGASRQLWTAPYSGLYASTHLAVREDRQLVLFVTDGSKWTAWSIDPRAQRARFTGRVDGVGQPVNAPIMGVHALVLPTLVEDAIHYEKLPVERFQEGVACSGL